MPISLSNTSSPNEQDFILGTVTFSDGDDGRFFKLSDDKGNEIRVEYIPKEVSHWDPDRYEIILFENPYLNAENDVFELYETTLDGRFGWIFPIATLESNENDYVDYKNFKHYRYVAYHKLLQLNAKLIFQELKQEYRLSEVFPNVCVCLLSKDEIAKIEEFNIENYVLSFLNYDYLLFHESIKGKAVFNKTDFIDDIRKGNHRINIKKSSFDISENQYTKSLFIEHLYQSENFLVRYIFLYQILEHFIQEQADIILDKLIEDYQKKVISKNTLREKIGKFSNDRSLVKKVFEKSTIDQTLRDDFVERCGFLFTDIGEEVEQNFEDVLYDLRNLITHRYRTVVGKTDKLKEITWSFESIIIELLINFGRNTTTPVEVANVIPQTQANVAVKIENNIQEDPSG